MTINTLKENIEKIFLFIAIVLLAACGSETNNTENSDAITPIKVEPQNNEGFYDFPQPIEQVQLLQKAGATYDKSILNPLDNVSKYSVIKSQALNLGVYGADLSYAAVFNQAQDVILYLTASKKLAEALNIKGDFYTDIMKRMEGSSEDKDSLLQIISDVYQESNESLKENDQSHISALVVVGSFIEAMYIGTQVAKNVENKESIYERIGDFKGSLNNLVALIATAHESDFSGVLADLKSIKAIYDETEGSKLTEAQITKITKQIKAIRIKITNM
ncbi:MAG: hypothetical protein ACT4ON_09205 [Bacteroidota bacterium]